MLTGVPDKLSNLERTLLPRRGHLLVQEHPFPSCSTSILRAYKFFNFLSPPAPQILQFSVQTPLDRRQDLLPKDREELEGVAAAARRYEKVVVRRMVVNQKMTIRPVEVRVLSQSNIPDLRIAIPAYSRPRKRSVAEFRNHFGQCLPTLLFCLPWNGEANLWHTDLLHRAVF